MANFKKRALSLFVALIMVFSMMPMNAFAAEKYELDKEYEFAYNSDLPQLTGCVDWEFVEGSKTLDCDGHTQHNDDCYEPCGNCINGKVKCDKCGGTGERSVPCATCDGIGWLKIDQYGNLIKNNRTDCHEVGCANCDGKGYIVTKTGYGTVINGVFTECPHECDCFMGGLVGCYGDCFADCHCARQVLEKKECSWCDTTGYCNTGADGSTACWKKCDTCKGTKEMTIDCKGNNASVNGNDNGQDKCNNGVTDTTCTNCDGNGNKLKCNVTQLHTHGDACYKAMYKVVAKHTLTTVPAKAATCTEAGYSTHKACTVNGCGYTEGKTVYPVDLVNGHSWNETGVVTAPTCNAKGYTTVTCKHNSEHTKKINETNINPDNHAQNCTCTYTITFVNWDGTELQSSEVAYNTLPSYTDIPTKTGNAQYSYVFAGWDKDIVVATAETTYTATFTQVTNKYTVTWKNGDIDLETDENIEYGTTPEYNGETPVKEGNAQYSYTFAGWNPEISTVTGNVTYTAAFTQITNKYSVKFVDENGTLVWSDEFEYGATPVFGGTTPTKAADSKYTYTFSKWSPDLVAVTGEATYTATYTTAANPYTITFDSKGGSAVQPITLGYGETVTAPTAPTRAGYNFVGWTDLPETMPDHAVTVTANWEVVTGTYSATVHGTYNNLGTSGGGDAGWIQVGTAEYGIVTHPAAAQKVVDVETGKISNLNLYDTITWDGVEYKLNATSGNAYTFTPVKAVAVNGNTYHIDGNLTLTHTVTIDGEAQTVAHGTKLTLPAPTKEGHTFAGWTLGDEKYESGKEITVNDSITLTANWTINQYTITFNTDGGSEIAPITQDYNTKVTAPADPTKEGYTFAGWDAEIPETMPVNGAELTAQWTVNTYDVTWIVDGVETTTTETFGQEIVLPEDPTKEGYDFIGWNGIPEDGKMPANEELVITAEFVINQYTITFVLGNGSENITMTQDYGTVIEAPVNPVRASHTFDGWDVEIPATMPAGDMTITAQWTYVPYFPYEPDGDVIINDQDVPMGDGDDTTTIEDEETPLAAGELLNIEEFFAYINGYGEEVRPDNNITRAEFVTIIFRLLNDDVRLESWGTESRFADVTDPEAWYYNEVVTCDNLGILDYYEDNFEPNKAITRAEVAYIVAMFTGDAYEGEENLFTDIADSFAADAINDIATLGIIGGVGDNKFDPEANITRAAVTKMINLLLGRDAEKLEGDLMNWVDNADESKWFFDYIRVASNSFDAETFQVTDEKKDWAALEQKWAEEYAAMIAEGEDEAEDAE